MSEEKLEKQPTQQLSIKRFIAELSLNLKEWGRVANNQTESIVYIKAIRRLLGKYQDILAKADQARILYGTVFLIIRPNNWPNMTDKQVNGLKTEIDKFDDGLVSRNRIKSLMQRMRQLKIAIIDRSD